MIKDKYIDKLLSLYNNLTIIVDLEKKLISKAYDCERLVIENYTYSDFIDYVSKYKKFNKLSKDRLLIFFNELDSTEGKINLVSNLSTETNDIITLDIKGNKISDGEMLIVLSDLNAENYAKNDSLTKLLTRDEIVNKARSFIENKINFLLMIVDIDNFKAFNDNFGHMFGDIVLVETAASLKKHLKNTGTIGRIGGDEFMIIIEHNDNYDEIHKLCTNVRAAIANISNHNIKQVKITATVGCAHYPKDANNYELLFNKADTALLRGKNKGRNCFIIFDENKCGVVHEDDVKDNITSFEQSNPTATNSNIVAGVFEILNRGGNTRKNIDDSLSLIGTFFQLDRIDVVTLVPDQNDVLSVTLEWVNPRNPQNRGIVISGKNNIPLWRKAIDKTGMIKIVDIHQKTSHIDLYNLLKSQNTTALVAFEMKYMDKYMGLIRFDMCTKSRFWTQNDLSSLMLISKIFAIFLYKEYENVVHRHEIYFDKTTNVYNFSKWRDTSIERIENHNETNYSIINFHIHDFKKLNDLYGTNVCDTALKIVGNALRATFDNRAVYGRVNNDKFIIFINSQDKEYINYELNKIVSYFNKHFEYAEKFHITFGVYIRENKNEAFSTAIDRANIARRNHVLNKDNNITYYIDQFYLEIKRKAELEAHMFEALENDEFLLYLQPKINTDTGQIVGAEALTRWFYKKDKILTPNLFIPLFEENSFINELDYKVFENVCRFQKNCVDEGLKPIIISVNVSRYQLDFHRYIERINSIRNKYQINPNLIEIEITEGMYIENIDQMSEFLKILRGYGYRIAMDDFGSGYSNLSSLAALDFDVIKLDKSFCSNKDNEKELIILKFVMQLAKQLKMEVLCEGVETEEFCKYLQSLGCNLVQGFLFERPIPADTFKNKYLLK